MMNLINKLEYIMFNTILMEIFNMFLNPKKNINIIIVKCVYWKIILLIKDGWHALLRMIVIYDFYFYFLLILIMYFWLYLFI